MHACGGSSLLYSRKGFSEGEAKDSPVEVVLYIKAELIFKWLELIGDFHGVSNRVAP